MSANFLAFDLGAESGRAMSGHLRSGVLNLAEICRFPNDPVRRNGSLYWDVLRLWLHMQRALEQVSTDPRGLDSIGVDAWGCDYGLLGERGELLGNPFHYRDSRTDGIMASVFERVPRARIYEITGIQFLPFNTLYQLVAASRETPRLLDAATAFGTIPDILNCWLTGELRGEYTSATTTQMVDATERRWAVGLLQALDLPTRLLPELIEPGTILGALKPSVHTGLGGTPVVAPACHDTGSAVAAIPGGAGRAFLSSGTWSLLGTETAVPVITPAALQANFTNEGGVCGTDEAVEEHRRAVAAAGVPPRMGARRTILRLRRVDGRRGRRPPRVPVAVRSGRSGLPASPPTWPSRSPTTAGGPNSRSRSRRGPSRGPSSRVSPSSIASCSTRWRS
jgi:rhamnulokinase